ncbi:transmembrane and coiled-coil domains protein 1-like isoform X3 [Epinephelus fuscoguttatus]|uniref:transmembrane and coiled-coil domains protein 1-like isoform X3 n=1 Tax=Epinephelus fuscoguttatus TaxID=293821 RepID=UPI0020D099EB|nr:transmembrane and coiled-coil domains protein 1-like isoform X3 [Epinephelus fuscoguttatus]
MSGDRSLQLLSSHFPFSWSCCVQTEQNFPHLYKFGSTDNMATLKDFDETQEDESVSPAGARVLNLRYGSDDSSSAMSGSEGFHRGSPSSRDNTSDHIQASAFDAILYEIQELQEINNQLEECFENLKSYHQQNCAVILEALQLEQYRGECLEEQLNDLIELYQSEILNLKEELASMEEKTAHQSLDSVTDIHEALKACQTRLFKMEQQQHVMQLQGFENAPAGSLLGQLINVLLAVMAVILVFVSTVANCVVPLLRTYIRTVSTLLFVLLFSFLWGHWDAISEYPVYFFCTQHPEKGDNKTVSMQASL